MVRLKSYLEALGRYAGVQALLLSALTGLLLLAAGFGIAALTIWLSARLGAASACGVIGAGFLVVALLVLVAVMVHKHRRQATRSPLFTGQGSDQAALGSIAALAVLGYLLGRRVERR